jgi:hypothetical protein
VFHVGSGLLVNTLDGAHFNQLNAAAFIDGSSVGSPAAACRAAALIPRMHWRADGADGWTRQQHRGEFTPQSARLMMISS